MTAGEKSLRLKSLRVPLKMEQQDIGLATNGDTADVGHVKVAFGVAVSCHANGRLAEAEALCRAILAKDRRFRDAMVLLAVVLCLGGEPEARAEAIELLRLALTIRRDDAQALEVLGDALTVNGCCDDAVACYRHAVRLAPALARLRSKLGIALNDGGRHAEAIEALQQAVDRDPSSAAIHFNLGVALKAAGRLDAAVAAYRRVIELRPDGSDAYANLGVVLEELDRRDEAIACYRQALALDPAKVEAHVNLGAILAEFGRCDEAVAACRRALALDPAHVDAHINLGVALQRKDQHDAAIACYRQALALDLENPRALSNLGVAIGQQGHYDVALDALRRSAALAPNSGEIRFNLAVNLLRQGELVRGWEEYEWRWRGGVRGLKAPNVPQPLWQGEDLAGRTLLVRSEQGFGDILQFVRYLPALVLAGARVILRVPSALERLLHSSLVGVTVIGPNAPQPHFDFHIPLMSLPRLFGTDLNNIPAAVPYLAADPVAVAAWRQRLGADDHLRVGVVWSGNPGHKGDRQRSIAAATLLPELIAPGVRLFSLQKDGRPADQSTLLQLSHDVTDLSPQLRDFADTAAVLCALDLLISVDTSVVHLAGALGRPAWAMLPFTPDWRWLLGREDSPWYPTLRLYRQGRPYEWNNLFERLRADLRRQVAQLDLRPLAMDTVRDGALAAPATRRIPDPCS
jgi:tetratricopeptide (TPR) repeat protein